MFWKFIIILLRCQKKDYVKCVRMRKNIFIVDIHKYVSVEDMMKKAADSGVFAAEKFK